MCMKRFLAVSLITLGAGLSFGAQEHAKAPASPTKAASQRKTTRKRPARRTAHRKVPKKVPVDPGAIPWATFTSPEGRFSVLVPGQPTTDKQETIQSDHGPYDSHLMVFRDTKNVFIIGWVDYDPSFNFNRHAEMEMNRDVFVSDVKAKLLNSREVIVDGYRVLEFTAETAEKTYKSRVYMVGRRPYQIVIGSPSGEEDAATVDRFFNSFKVSPN